MGTYSRTPIAYHHELLAGSDLQDCREALNAAGFGVELPSGAKVVVSPEQYNSVIAHISSSELKLFPKHVIVAPEFEQKLQHAIAKLPSSLQAKPKKGREKQTLEIS